MLQHLQFPHTSKVQVLRPNRSATEIQFYDPGSTPSRTVTYLKQLRKCQKSKILRLDRKVSFEKFDFSSLVKIFPQTDFTIALDILFDNSLSIVFSPAPFAGFAPWESFLSNSSAWSSFSDTTGNSVEAPLLMSLPPCNKNK